MKKINGHLSSKQNYYPAISFHMFSLFYLCTTACKYTLQLIAGTKKASEQHEHSCNRIQVLRWWSLMAYEKTKESMYKHSIMQRKQKYSTYHCVTSFSLLLLPWAFKANILFKTKVGKFQSRLSILDKNKLILCCIGYLFCFQHCLL